MITKPRDPGSFPPEKDLLDDEQRDLDSGWPYGDGETAPADTASAGSGFEIDANAGLRITDADTGTDTDSGDERPRPPVAATRAGDAESESDIEERVTDSLGRLKDLNITTIDVRAHGRTVVLEGAVDNLVVSRQAELCAQAVSGVTTVRNNLTLLAVDSHMPDDD